MAIRQLSKASISTGSKSSKFWDQAATLGAYELIERITIGIGGQSTITFSSIPSTYKHLQIRAIMRSDRSSTGDDIKINFNSDTGNNYSAHIMGGEGATTYANAQTSLPFMITYYGVAAASAISNSFDGMIIDILDYSNTNKKKTMRLLHGWDNNGGGNIEVVSGAWYNTSAVSTITLAPRYGTIWVQNSHFALYGIKG